jgi:zona occludens toxin (predicted ATPase)
MEILIAILWYLQVLIVGNTYTTTQFDAMVNANQPQITTIQSDSQLTNDIYNSYMTTTSHDTKIVEPWEDDDTPPIRN